MSYNSLIILSLLGAYMLGSLSFAIIVSKIMQLSDPRTYGSGNAGATNVMRSGNKKAATITLIGDLLKGLIVVLIARMLSHNLQDSSVIVALCGILVVIGHIYPIFFKFKGGKGVATAVGVFLGFNVWLAMLLIITWLVIFKMSKISSLSALVATILAPIYAYFLMGNNAYFGGTLVIAFFILYKHKSNIIRLLTGKEHSFKSDNNE